MENENLKKDENLNQTDEINDNVNQKETKNSKKGKVKTIVLMIIVLVLVLIIGVLCGLFFSGNGDKVTNIINQVTENKEENKTSKKIDENKPWVYDADYIKDKEDKTKTSNLTTSSFKASEEIKLPYININSDDAKKINDEIKGLFDKAYNEFGDLIEMTDYATGKKTYNENSFSYTGYDYAVYENNNIVSIVITKTYIVVPGDITTSYITYNFDLDTLKLLKVDDVLKSYSFDSKSDLNQKLQIAIKSLELQGEAVATDYSIWDGERFFIKNNRINAIVPGLALSEHIIVADANASEVVKETTSNNQNTANNNKDNQENVNENVKSELKKYEKDDFYFYAPESWNCQIKKNSQYAKNKDDEYYEITGNVNGKEKTAFSILITKDSTFDNSSWVNKGEYNDYRYIYLMKNFICRENDGNSYNSADYKFESEIDEVIKSFTVKYIVKNEFGSADATKTLEGIYFMRGEGGTSERSHIYYIQDGKLCRTSLTDDFATVVLASDTKFICRDYDGRIHAYPEGDSFKNNIAQEDDSIIYENKN